MSRAYDEVTFIFKLWLIRNGLTIESINENRKRGNLDRALSKYIDRLQTECKLIACTQRTTSGTILVN